MSFNFLPSHYFKTNSLSNDIFINLSNDYFAKLVFQISKLIENNIDFMKHS